MFTGGGFIYLVYACAAISAIIIAEAVFLLVARKGEQREAVNRRMRLKTDKVSQNEVLQLLKKERGLDDGTRVFSLGRLKKLRVQSGMRMPMQQFLSITSLASAIGGGLLLVKGFSLVVALCAFLALALVSPVMVLRFLHKRRLKLFGLQLPESLELITRGLKAGHPVPVAVTMVGREMPDPIGTEFGLVADEITYGSDLVTALQSMYHRVGHEDLPLFVTAVSIQTTSGGNLREILEGLSNTIRERGKLRRKVRAISTEGRMSAYILTAVPVLLFAVIITFFPQFYNEVWGETLTWILLGTTAAWVLIGNFAMFKMATFKF